MSRACHTRKRGNEICFYVLSTRKTRHIIAKCIMCLNEKFLFHASNVNSMYVKFLCAVFFSIVLPFSFTCPTKNCHKAECWMNTLEKKAKWNFFVFFWLKPSEREQRGRRGERTRKNWAIKKMQICNNVIFWFCVCVCCEFEEELRGSHDLMRFLNKQSMNI